MTLYADVDIKGECVRQPTLQCTRMEAVHLLSVLSSIVKVFPSTGKSCFDIPIENVQVRRK